MAAKPEAGTKGVSGGSQSGAHRGDDALVVFIRHSEPYKHLREATARVNRKSRDRRGKKVARHRPCASSSASFAPRRQAHPCCPPRNFHSASSSARCLAGGTRNHAASAAICFGLRKGWTRGKGGPKRNVVALRMGTNGKAGKRMLGSSTPPSGLYGSTESRSIPLALWPGL